jgi:general secretion pathway protein D
VRVEYRFGAFARIPAVLFAVLLLCSGCQSLDETIEWSPAPLERNPNLTAGAPSGSDGISVPDYASPAGAGTVSRHIGSGRLIGSAKRRSSSGPADENDGVTLNLVNAPIAVASKTILGDILRLNYTVSTRLDGRVTLQTSTPVSKAGLVDLFQNALRSSGATITRSGDLYHVDTLDQAARMPSSVTTGTESPSGVEIGNGNRIVQLKFVSAAEMRRILEPIVPRGALLSASDSRNTLTLNGTPSDISTMLDTIAIFDVDVMRGMSVAIVPVSTVQPEAIVQDLRSIFGADREGPMSGMVRFLPNPRLKAVLVISPQAAYLKRAEGLIQRFDAKAQGFEKKLYTYNVQHRSAKELVTVVESMFSSKAARVSQSVAPRYQESSLRSEPPVSGTSGGGSSFPSRFSLASTSNGSNPPTLQGAPAPGAANGPPDEPAASQPGGTDVEERVKISADEGNNALLILASKQDYQRALEIIKSLDTMPMQVMIEATIAEVTLNDDLRFGVRWYFENGKSSIGLTDAAAKVFGSVYPGFSYALAAANVQVTVNALNAITTVNIVSSPSLTVMNNRTATLQIGDQVPVVTQSASSVVSPGAPVVNSVNYRDTGVILSITPRINESGMIVLNIEQEVSNVANTTTSNIDSPTIKQRRVKTTVVVNDGETLALGGLMQDQISKGRSQIPILGDIPILGNAFGQKNSTVGKTELIVLLTPKVARNPIQARAISDEFRKQFDVSMPRSRGVQRPIVRTVIRTFE